MKKVAITLTDHHADAIEGIRQQLGLTRSRVMQQALDFYLASQSVVEEMDAAYEAGYRSLPEHAGDIEAYARTPGEVLVPED